MKFWWAARHLKRGKLVTLVSTRSSGSSRVELQNGCLALAHTNLFIPSTLSGSALILEKLFCASGLTQTGARKIFGFEGMDTRGEKVEKCIEAA